MTQKRWNGSAFVDNTTAKRWNGSAWVDLTLAKRWDGAAWIDISLPGGGGGFSATVSNGNPQGNAFAFEPAPLAASVTTNSTTVTPSGGTAPYTYSWAHIAGDSAVSVSNPTAATVTFSANVFKNQEKEATFRCTVTDAVLATTTVDVVAYLSYSTDL